jgi:hypothetical protein
MLRIANLVHRTAQGTAARSWRAHEFLVAAGFEERRLLPERAQGRAESNHVRVKSLTGLR